MVSLVLIGKRFKVEKLKLILLANPDGVFTMCIILSNFKSKVRPLLLLLFSDKQEMSLLSMLVKEHS